jgi:hypothetical protein
VDEDHRDAGAGLLAVQSDAVPGANVRHSRSLSRARSYVYI